ncbi:MAG: DUF2007 domain-containing protein [Verrucomicrobiaceae bacterium]
MKPVFVDPDLTRVGFAKNILESGGIACFIQNENTRTLGPNLFGYSYTALLDPVLCVLDDRQVDLAKDLLHEHFGSTIAGGDWVCSSCKESNPASFELCWNCQAPKHE